MSEREQTKFDEALRQALRPVDAPETLARFLAIAAAAEEKRRSSGRRSSGRWAAWFRPSSGGGVVVLPRPQRLPMWMSGAVAAMLVLGVFAGQQVHVRHERQRADREFSMSLQIEEQAMAHTRQQLQKAGVPLE